MEHDAEALKDRLRAEAKEGKMPCSVALKISKEMDIPSKVVGAALDKLEIRIIKCQLGCFE